MRWSASVSASRSRASPAWRRSSTASNSTIPRARRSGWRDRWRRHSPKRNDGRGARRKLGVAGYRGARTRLVPARWRRRPGVRGTGGGRGRRRGPLARGPTARAAGGVARSPGPWPARPARGGTAAPGAARLVRIGRPSALLRMLADGSGPLETLRRIVALARGTWRYGVRVAIADLHARHA